MSAVTSWGEVARFEGNRVDGAVKVTLVTTGGKRRALAPRLGWRNHSPDGFEWGYCGSGPSQLALAIVGALYEKPVALGVYQEFKRTVVANMDQRLNWVLDASYVRDAVEGIRNASEQNADDVFEYAENIVGEAARLKVSVATDDGAAAHQQLAILKALLRDTREFGHGGDDLLRMRMAANVVHDHLKTLDGYDRVRCMGDDRG